MVPKGFVPSLCYLFSLFLQLYNFSEPPFKFMEFCSSLLSSLFNKISFQSYSPHSQFVFGSFFIYIYIIYIYIYIYVYLMYIYPMYIYPIYIIYNFSIYICILYLVRHGFHQIESTFGFFIPFLN